MNPQLLCRWLSLPDCAWPPAPHVLVGVAADEHDPARIEAQVHERMAKLRTYQNSHPEEATEGMNRVAQAFGTLTENGAATSVPEPAIFTPVGIPASASSSSA